MLLIFSFTNTPLFLTPYASSCAKPGPSIASIPWLSDTSSSLRVVLPASMVARAFPLSWLQRLFLAISNFSNAPLFLMASAKSPMLLLLMFRLVNALMAENISGVGQRGYSCTYWHLGRKAASMMAPEASKSFPLKSALVMDVSMVTASLSLESPLMVSLFNALMAENISGVGLKDILVLTGTWGERQ